MYKYGMDPTRTVGVTEQTQDAGRMDGQTDGRTDGLTDGVKTIYPPTTSLFGGYNYDENYIPIYNIIYLYHMNWLYLNEIFYNI